MSNFPDREQVAYLRRKYPDGTRITLTAPLDDPYSTLAVGDKATVKGVDDAGHILCKWDNGSGLNLIPGVDSFDVDGISDTVFDQIMQIRKLPAAQICLMSRRFSSLQCKTICRNFAHTLP
jgi:hypothetical protein